MNENTSFDMTQCKLGDKLLLRNGSTVIYVGTGATTSSYPHNIGYVDGAVGFRDNAGHPPVGSWGRARDVVGIVTTEASDQLLPIIPRY